MPEASIRGTLMESCKTQTLLAALFNRPLQEAMQKNLELVGAPRFEEDEQRFARELQRGLKVPGIGLDTTIRKLAADVDRAGAHIPREEDGRQGVQLPDSQRAETTAPSPRAR